MKPAGHPPVNMDVDQAKATGCADEPLPLGSLLWLASLGVGEYERFERSWFGANSHYIRTHSVSEEYCRGDVVEVFSKSSSSWREGMIITVDDCAETVKVEYANDNGALMHKVLEHNSEDLKMKKDEKIKTNKKRRKKNKNKTLHKVALSMLKPEDWMVLAVPTAVTLHESEQLLEPSAEPKRKLEPSPITDNAALKSYLSLVAINPRRGSVWGGKTITELQACQRRLAVGIALHSGDRSALRYLDYDVLAQMCQGPLHGIACFDRAGELPGHSPIADTSIGMSIGCHSEYNRRGQCYHPGTLVTLESSWSRWMDTQLGSKGGRHNIETNPPSTQSFVRVMAAVDVHGVEKDQLSQTLNRRTQGDEMTRADAVAFWKALHSTSRADEGCRKVKLKWHIDHYLPASSTDEKACLKRILHQGFHESVHVNINDAVDGTAEFSPDVVMEHLDCGSDVGWYTTATAHTLCVKLKYDALQKIQRPMMKIQWPLDAGISYRRLVRQRIVANEIVESELIYEILFLASAEHFRRCGVGTALVNKLKAMLRQDSVQPEGVSPFISKRSLCVSIKSESKAALSFWVSMGLMPCSEDEPSEKQIMDLMVPFADFTPVATTWAELSPRAPRRKTEAQALHHA